LNIVHSATLLLLFLFVGLTGFILFIRGLVKNKTKLWLCGVSLLGIAVAVMFLFASPLLDKMTSVKLSSADEVELPDIINNMKKTVHYNDEVFVICQHTQSQFRFPEIYIHELLKQINIIESCIIIDVTSEKILIELSIGPIVRATILCTILNNVYEPVYKNHFNIQSDGNDAIQIEMDFGGLVDTDELNYMLIQINNN